MGLASSLKERTKNLKRDVHALYLAYRDPRVPLRAKLLIVVLIGYAASPIDLIPDFIPVLGYLDDLILLPLGVSVAIKMIPKDVLSECMEKASAPHDEGQRKNWLAAFLIILLWLAAIVLIGRAVWHYFLG